jgi:hypothetical protein
MPFTDKAVAASAPAIPDYNAQRASGRSRRPLLDTLEY